MLNRPASSLARQLPQWPSRIKILYTTLNPVGAGLPAMAICAAPDLSGFARFFFKLIRLKQTRQFRPGFLGGLQDFGCVVIHRVLRLQHLFVVVLEAFDPRIGLGLGQPEANQRAPAHFQT